MTETESLPAINHRIEVHLSRGFLRCTSDLAVPHPTMTPAHTNRDVMHHFRDHPDLICLPVVEDGMPIGLINRSIFMSGYSLPFHREVYERKSCIAFMDKAPLIVEGDLPITELGRQAVEAGSKVLNDGFLVTRQGSYVGLGSGIDLLKALGQLEAERNRVIRESIDYAQIIQGSLLATSLSEFAAGGCADHHLLYQPRDVVGGDAFFAKRYLRDGRKGLFLALMDCTGHGVPGAFTAMLMTSFLGHALDMALPWEPGKVLAAVNRRVKAELGQSHQGDSLGRFGTLNAVSRADEGMDATCLWLDPAAGEIVFSGANHSLWVVPPGAVEPDEIKGDRIGVGYVSTPDDQTWASQSLNVAPGTLLFGMTDGIVDQIGGPRRIAFGKRRFWEALMAGERALSLQSRLEQCYSTMKAYQGLEERRDDICLMGLRVGGHHAA